MTCMCWYMLRGGTTKRDSVIFTYIVRTWSEQNTDPVASRMHGQYGACRQKIVLIIVVESFAPIAKYIPLSKRMFFLVYCMLILSKLCLLIPHPWVGNPNYLCLGCLGALFWRSLGLQIWKYIYKCKLRRYTWISSFYCRQLHAAYDIHVVAF